MLAYVDDMITFSLYLTEIPEKFTTDHYCLLNNSFMTERHSRVEPKFSEFGA